MDRFVLKAKPEQMLKTEVFDKRFGYVAAGISKKKLSQIMFNRQKNTITKLDTAVFAPGQPQITDSGAFNFYTMPDIVAAQGETDLWNEHLVRLFPDDHDRKCVLDWLAWIVQNVGLKPKHALLIAGHVQGSGKSFIMEVLARILGRSNVNVVGPAELSSSFNKWALNAKLLWIEELRAIERREIANKLHPIITQELIPINDKGIATFKIENCFGILAMTNDEAAIQLDNTDRRYLVVRTEAEACSPEYGRKLYLEALPDDAFIAAVAYELLHRDLQGYSAAGRAPDTTAKLDMIEAGRSELETWLHENESNYSLGCDMITLDDVVADIPTNMRRGNIATARTVRAFIKHHKKARQFAHQHRLPDGRRVRLWALNGKFGILDKIDPTERVKIYLAKRRDMGSSAAAQSVEDFEEAD
jgi:hypothetical protein